MYCTVLTCNELITVNIQAKTSNLLSAKNRRPKIHVPQSNGRSARMLRSKVLQNFKYIRTFVCTVCKYN